MKKIILAAALVLVAATSTVRASEQSAQETQGVQNEQGAQATCYAFDAYGRQYYWMHPVPAVASQMVMNACFQNTGYPCTPGGCTF